MTVNVDNLYDYGDSDDSEIIVSYFFITIS
jgi:hypothetical protein